MAHAEKCPICNGTGKIFKESTTTAEGYEIVCHGCSGKGWVVVSINYKEDIGKLFTTDAKEIWKLIAYADDPIVCFRNIETKDIQAMGINSLDIEKFKKLEIEKEEAD